jgi:hypothetical protein
MSKIGNDEEELVVSELDRVRGQLRDWAECCVSTRANTKEKLVVSGYSADWLSYLVQC